MTINVKIGEDEKPIQAIAKLQARRTLDGNLMIFNHRDIDIVMMPKKRKILALAKEDFDDFVYDTQDRFFKYLQKKGVIEPDSIRGGNIFMSMEGTISESNDYNPNQIALFAIAKFIEDERPYFEYQDWYEKEEENRLAEPPEDETTDWDPKRLHKDEKGSIKPNIRPYGISSIYRFEE